MENTPNSSKELNNSAATSEVNLPSQERSPSLLHIVQNVQKSFCENQEEEEEIMYNFSCLHEPSCVGSEVEFCNIKREYRALKTYIYDQTNDTLERRLRIKNVKTYLSKKWHWTVKRLKKADRINLATISCPFKWHVKNASLVERNKSARKLTLQNIRREFWPCYCRQHSKLRIAKCVWMSEEYPEEMNYNSVNYRKKRLPKIPTCSNWQGGTAESVSCNKRKKVFRILNVIEEGGFGLIYRARDRRTNKIVALKMVKTKPEEEQAEGFPITALREIGTMMKVKHKNIVNVQEIVTGHYIGVERIYIVMEYVKYDVKYLIDNMTHYLALAEVKNLLIQLLRGISHLHDHWIIHRDIKTSNLLLSTQGVLKITDFGWAREYGSPLKPYTPNVVTLWYRSPELLVGGSDYSTSVDMWSVGCVLGEMLQMRPLFLGTSEIDQLQKIFSILGTPSIENWPSFAQSSLQLTDSVCILREQLESFLRSSVSGFPLIENFLHYDPEQRMSADNALQHDFFFDEPLPLNDADFRNWPLFQQIEDIGDKPLLPKHPAGWRDDKFWKMVAANDLQNEFYHQKLDMIVNGELH